MRLGLEPSLDFSHGLTSGFVFSHRSKLGEDFKIERGPFLKCVVFTFYSVLYKTCPSLFVILYFSLYNFLLGFSTGYYPILVPHSIYIDTQSLLENSNATLANKHKQTNSVL